MLGKMTMYLNLDENCLTGLTYNKTSYSIYYPQCIFCFKKKTIFLGYLYIMQTMTVLNVNPMTKLKRQ